MLPEGFLQWMQVSIAGQALNRRDLRALRLDGEHATGTRGAAIDTDGARTAHAVFAAKMYTGEAEILP
ncbi:hypothetical protein GCM10025762_57130 [Haloechinothrix salitolerans]